MMSAISFAYCLGSLVVYVLCQRPDISVTKWLVLVVSLTSSGWGLGYGAGKMEEEMEEKEAECLFILSILPPSYLPSCIYSNDPSFLGHYSIKFAGQHTLA